MTIPLKNTEPVFSEPALHHNQPGFLSSQKTDFSESSRRERLAGGPGVDSAAPMQRLQVTFLVGELGRHCK